MSKIPSLGQNRPFFLPFLPFFGHVTLLCFLKKSKNGEKIAQFCLQQGNLDMRLCQKTLTIMHNALRNWAYWQAIMTNQKAIMTKRCNHMPNGHMDMAYVQANMPRRCCYVPYMLNNMPNELAFMRYGLRHWANDMSLLAYRPSVFPTYA